MDVDHWIARSGCSFEGASGSVVPLVLAGGRIIFWCPSCASFWCDTYSLSGPPSSYDTDRVICGEVLDRSTIRRGIAQDLQQLNTVEPIWSVGAMTGRSSFHPPDDFVVDHSGYVLSVGACSECDQDRVLAWVTVSGRLVFRCPDGHENAGDSDGRVFPLWWVPDSDDPSVAVERFANAGDIAAIIAAGGPRSVDDDELGLFDVKWAILVRP